MVRNEKSNTVVNQYQIMETPVKAETSQVHCLQKQKCQAKEANREDVLANKPAFPRAYTNWATDALLAKSKQTAVMAMMRPTEAKRKTVLVQHNTKICSKGSKTNGLKRKQGTKSNKKNSTTSGPCKKAAKQWLHKIEYSCSSWRLLTWRSECIEKLQENQCLLLYASKQVFGGWTLLGL
jgi:hypothetical protein